MLSGARIKQVCEGSIASQAGIRSGDVLFKVNGEEFYDILEYKFLISDDELELEVIRQEGYTESIHVYNEDYKDIGIVFERPLISNVRTCSNRCIFCFIDQLPKGMRKPLYFKDDDSRMSFLHGNYITLTNMTDDDIERIIRFRLSPINISVHTTNPELRIQMMRNKKAGRIIERIKRIVAAHITVNAQIVLCRDVNDKKELDRTISDLSSLYPYVHSISVVPVGLTKYRNELFQLKSFDKKTAQEVIKQMQSWQENLYSRYKSRVVYLADEFYLLAGYPIPEYGHYEDFPQIENGVGLMASLEKEFCEEWLKINRRTVLKYRNISIATGVAAQPFIQSLCNDIVKEMDGLHINVYSIQNQFFGDKITVAGLVTGQDLINQLSGVYLGDELLIPEVMLRSDKDIFLDDISIRDIETSLDIKVTVVANNGYDFVYKILGTENV